MTARDRPTRSAVITGLFELVGLCHCRVRLEILLAVLRRPDDVGSLSKRLRLDLSHVSRYLQTLEAAGLVKHNRVGHRHHYRAGPKARLTSRGADLVLVLLADDGSEVSLLIPAHMLAELVGSDPQVVVLPQSGRVSRRGPRPP